MTYHKIISLTTEQTSNQQNNRFWDDYLRNMFRAINELIKNK